MILILKIDVILSNLFSLSFVMSSTLLMTYYQQLVNKEFYFAVLISIEMIFCQKKRLQILVRIVWIRLKLEWRLFGKIFAYFCR